MQLFSRRAHWGQSPLSDGILTSLPTILALGYRSTPVGSLSEQDWLPGCLTTAGSLCVFELW